MIDLRDTFEAVKDLVKAAKTKDLSVASFCCLCGSIAARSGRAILARGTGTSGYLLRHALASALCKVHWQTDGQAKRRNALANCQ